MFHSTPCITGRHKFCTDLACRCTCHAPTVHAYDKLTGHVIYAGNDMEAARKAGEERNRLTGACVHVKRKGKLVVLIPGKVRKEVEV